MVGVEGPSSPLALLGLYKALSAILRAYESESSSDELQSSAKDSERPTEPSSSPPEDTLRMKLERLVTNDYYFTAQETTHQAMQAQDNLIIGWTRDMEATACQLCRWWDRDGRVWPVTHRMPTHKGCACSQKPVIKKLGKESRHD